jgi:DNA-binding response OmpR family regulator
MNARQRNPDSEQVEIRRVLIVEDEPSAREATQRYLTRRGFAADAAADATEALAAAENLEPDLAVCDWRLGGGRDGVDVARELQRRYGTAIIFITALPLERLREATQDLSVAAYMHKPISLVVLAEKIAALGALG